MASDRFLHPERVAVLRDGTPMPLPATSLVPGDIVGIVAGQKVPADVKLIEVHDGLRFDRSMFTGEVCVKTRLRAHNRDQSPNCSRVNRSSDA